jgi:hypothetical protein
MRIIIIQSMLNEIAGMKTQSDTDHDLPNANAVMASLCCVAAQYAANPSLELATLAADLSRQLATPRYAESRLVSEVAQRLVRQWDAIVNERNATFATLVPASPALH